MMAAQDRLAAAERELLLQRYQEAEEIRKDTLKHLPERSAEALPKVKEALRNILSDVASAMAQLQAKSLLAAEWQIAHAFRLADDRAILVTYSTLLSTYASRIGPRADTLIKQVKGDDRRELPLSVALRETTSPAYIKQYIWNDTQSERDFILLAGREAETAGRVYGGVGSDDVRARVKAVERLFLDENWSNINTVHASGQGTVRMALIKDDIGNWNLKSFDQDPSRLLDAYKSVGLAALATVAETIQQATGTGQAFSAATQLSGAANTLAFGRAAGASPTLGTRNLDILRAEAAKRMEGVRDEIKSKDDDLLSRINAIELDVQAKKNTAEGALAEVLTASGRLEQARKKEADLDPAKASEAEKQAAKQDVSDRTKDLQAAKDRLQTAQRDFGDIDRKSQALQAEKRGLPQAAVGKAMQILQDHRAVVDALEGAVVRERAAAGATVTPSRVPDVPLPGRVVPQVRPLAGTN